MIVLDNDRAQIGEKLPGDKGYTQAALSSTQKQILFEAGEEVGTLKSLSLDAGDYIMFYMVQNDRSTNVIDSDTNIAPVFFSAFIRQSNNDSFAHFQSITANENEIVVGIEDLVGGDDRHFNDVILSVTPKELVVPGRAGEIIQATATYEGKSAQMDSEVGLIVYDDSSEQIEGLLPGNAGYARAALSSLTRHSLFDAGAATKETKTLDLTGGQSVGLYLIVGGTFEQWLEQNPENLATKKPYVLFDRSLANPDGINHFNRWGEGEYRLEDVLNGGDLDFNDLRIRLKFHQPE